MRRIRFLPVLILSHLIPTVAKAEDSIAISVAKPDDSGVLVHEVRSPYQAKPTRLRVLLPDPVEKGRTYPVVYILPVEAGTENRYGDGLAEIQKQELHKKHRAIFAAPTFSHLPWYADHPTDPALRQEGYFLNVIVPFVDKTYPVRGKSEERHLLGFSKSGWGAWSLLLRYPERFGKAAAWDAPLMMDGPGKYGSGPIFGTKENFAKYRITTLLADRADRFRSGKRLLLLGAGNFQSEHEQAHTLMNRLKIDHDYADGPVRKHDWHSGWVKHAVERLLAE